MCLSWYMVWPWLEYQVIRCFLGYWEEVLQTTISPFYGLKKEATNVLPTLTKSEFIGNMGNWFVWCTGASASKAVSYLLQIVEDTSLILLSATLLGTRMRITARQYDEPLKRAMASLDELGFQTTAPLVSFRTNAMLSGHWQNQYDSFPGSLLVGYLNWVGEIHRGTGYLRERHTIHTVVNWLATSSSALTFQQATCTLQVLRNPIMPSYHFDPFDTRCITLGIRRRTVSALSFVNNRKEPQEQSAKRCLESLSAFVNWYCADFKAAGGLLLERANIRVLHLVTLLTAACKGSRRPPSSSTHMNQPTDCIFFATF